MRCLVVGGGSTGAFLAYCLAERGVQVLLCERRTLANAGANWINAVESNIFGDLQLPDPPDEVIFDDAQRFVMSTADNSHRVTIDHHPLIEVDMGALNRWLIELAQNAGAEVRERTKVDIGRSRNGCRKVRLAGREEEFDVVLDASGYHADALKTIDPDDRLPFTGVLDVCSAFQGVYEITDRYAARSWLDDNAIAAGDIWSRTAVEGGYSILNASIDEDFSRISVLTGAMHRDAYRPGGTIAGDFVRGHAFIGKRLLGGGRLIPLAPPAATLVDDALVRVGDAAGQVFPLHGSGVAQGLRAADIAANAVAAALQLGDTSAQGLWGYNVAWQRSHGALNAFHQPLRQLVSSLTAHENRVLIGHGLLGSATVRAGLAQKMPPLDPGALVGALMGLPELLPLVPRLATAAGLAAAMQMHWKVFPNRGPRGEFVSWANRARALAEKAQALALSGEGDGSLPT